MVTFENIGISENILKAVKELGFEKPMPIQEKVIPILLEKPGDLVGLAQTGTGKTAAFGLPIIQLADPDKKYTQAIILAPTRELCLQITGDLKKFAKYIPKLNIEAVYGGADIEKQIRAIKKGAHVIVATPGRMNDLLNYKKVIDLSSLETVVLDEADEMLNMGFRDELDAILDQTPKTKNVLLFSATMPREVLEISSNYMTKPIEITIGVQNAGSDNVEHAYYRVHVRDRYLALKRVVDFYPGMYSIIFCRTREETKDVADKLIQDGYNADALHGDLSQNQRESIMNRFRIKHLQILVATDVAARGLDVKDISHVINFNLPDDDDVYNHRSGRTGRAGQKGVAISLVSEREYRRIRQIESKIKRKFTKCKIHNGTEICENQLLHMIDKLQATNTDHKALEAALPKIQAKLEHLEREDLIKLFVSMEFSRLLEYYRDARDLNPAEERSRTTRNEGAVRTDRAPRNYAQADKSNKRAEEGFIRYSINLGYKDNLTPAELIGLINRCTRRRNIDIGKIDLMNTSSFFEIDHKSAPTILNAFKGMEYNNRAVVVQVSSDAPPQAAATRSRKGAPANDNSNRWQQKKSPYSNDERPQQRSSRKSSYQRAEA
ncbi:DEAD/DEAH box helicase [Desulforegula conservatrix]|uniref:DEAD/DEAH box helicase n=1 Tax=Desulforegula conservatrix TaxID=153026 RepID=UPI0003FB8FB2|nr:DEAD/DEAH box helicase [Desulforegula conservatrix]